MRRRHNLSKIRQSIRLEEIRVIPISSDGKSRRCKRRKVNDEVDDDHSCAATSPIVKVWELVSNIWSNTASRRNKMNEQFYQPQSIRAFMEECDAVNDLYANCCWSVLMSLDADLCVQHFKILPSEVVSLNKMITQIRADLKHLHEFSRRVKIDAKFELFETEAIEQQQQRNDKRGIVGSSRG